MKITNKFLNWWKSVMLWLQIVKIIIKHSKEIQKDLKKEKSSRDDSPGVITADEYAMVITDGLLECVPELVATFQKHNKKR
jgi:hypothetical protein